MGTNRVPGPVGIRLGFGCSLTRKPTGHHWGLDLGLEHYGTPSTPGTIDRNIMSEAIASAFKEYLANRQADEDELKLLVKVYKAVRNKKGNTSYSYWSSKKKKRVYDVDEYVKDRNAFFGSAENYRTFLAESRKELEDDKKKLRRFIEPPLGDRKKLVGWEKAQDVFYAWVRKAYQIKLGNKVDIPKLIKSQMSEELKKALKQVKLDYGESFQSGGFNPRPMKLNGYRLGTISEHAVGTAIDIESAKNAHIKTAEWEHILKFTGKSMSHSDRQSKWKSKPKELFDHIQEVNDEFVKKLKKELTDVVADAKKKEETAKALADAAQDAVGADSKSKAVAAAEKKKHQQAEKEYKSISNDPMAAVMKSNADLKMIGKVFLKRWRGGFFDLPWKLVKELHEEKFLWGATFSHPDLHHFEL